MVGTLSDRQTSRKGNRSESAWPSKKNWPAKRESSQPGWLQAGSFVRLPGACSDDLESHTRAEACVGILWACLKGHWLLGFGLPSCAPQASCDTRLLRDCPIPQIS